MCDSCWQSKELQFKLSLLVFYSHQKKWMRYNSTPSYPISGLDHTPHANIYWSSFISRKAKLHQCITAFPLRRRMHAKTQGTNPLLSSPPSDPWEANVCNYHCGKGFNFFRNLCNLHLNRKLANNWAKSAWFNCVTCRQTLKSMEK